MSSKMPILFAPETQRRELNYTKRFSVVTETPSSLATSDQCTILFNRYHLASQYCANRNVLEIGCGSGIGLGYLATAASRIIGGDIDPENCSLAKSTYRNSSKVEIQQIDAQHLPFPSESFDVVILFETLYYIGDSNLFFREAQRVLRPGGFLVISTVNCLWGGFCRSLYSTRYFTATELCSTLTHYGFRAEIFVSFPERTDGLHHNLARVLRRSAVQLKLIPKTMKRKKWLKRLFYGKLISLPRVLPEGFAPIVPVKKIYGDDETKQFRIVYAIGQRS